MRLLILSAVALSLSAPAADAGPIRRAVARVVAGPRCGQVARPLGVVRAVAFPAAPTVAPLGCVGGRCPAR